MNEHRIRARCLLRKAQEDAVAAKCLSSNPEVSLWTIGFHVQQAVEKTLKAVMTWNRITYPFTHDIAALLRLVEASGISLPPSAALMKCLSPFGAFFRYDDEEWRIPSVPDTRTMLEWAEDAIQWAQQQLESESRNQD